MEIETLSQITNDLSSHAKLDSAFEHPNRILSHIEATFRTLQVLGAQSAVRAYTDWAQDFEIQDRIESERFSNAVTLEQWLKQVFRREQFCVSINGLTRWNSEFAGILCSEFVQPLQQKYGVPPRGVDFYTFLGIYEETSFGVHFDFDHSLLVHLGPGSKECWIWPKQRYLKLTGSAESTFGRANIVNDADYYVLRPGDMIFIPEGDFHVFRCDTFSATLGMTIFPCSERTYFQQITSLIDDGISDYPSRFPANMMRRQDWLRSLTSISDLHSEFQRAIKRQLYLHKSNYYVMTPPVRTACRDLIDSMILRCTKPFELLHRDRSDGSCEVFVRGRSIVVNEASTVKRLLSILNESTPMRIRDITNILSDEWKPDATMRFIQIICELGGASVCTSGSLDD